MCFYKHYIFVYKQHCICTERVCDLIGILGILLVRADIEAKYIQEGPAQMEEIEPNAAHLNSR